jgi:hypothetical protein
MVWLMMSLNFVLEMVVLDLFVVTCIVAADAGSPKSLDAACRTLATRAVDSAAVPCKQLLVCC